MPRVARRPAFSGSWYDGSGAALTAQITEWMGAVGAPPAGTHAQAIIAPHAGYSYSGHVMAYAYKHIDASRVSRVFLLGPSHKLYTKKCLLSSAAEYSTPLGPLPIDQEVYSQLLQHKAFEQMDVGTDEAEHSLELHTPYIAHIMAGRPFSLVPIMVGALSTASEAAYGALLAPFLDDPSNLFIVSSDFCHWGHRFSYTLVDERQGPIWKSIEWLDKEGMDAIESGSPQRFADYLDRYHNTICGRHPIAVLLNMLACSSRRYAITFRHYAQSSRCEVLSDSSVSYAAATVVAEAQQ